MRIAVFGAGGVGGYFGGRLAQAGEQVVFIARGDHLKAIRETGLRVDSTRGDFHLHPAEATENPADVGPVDAVLVAVKAWQVPDAARAMLPMLGLDTFVVPLENGVEAASQLSAVLGEARVLGGLCRIFSYIVTHGHIRHGGAEPSVAFGELDNRVSERAIRLKEAFQKAGVAVEIPQDIHVAIWQKFLFISSLSGVGAVTRAPVGILRSIPETRTMLEEAMREVFTVARARGIQLPDSTLTKTMSFVDALPPEGTASMQRDIAEGRPSELESQNGAVVKLGREAGIATPVHTFIYHALLPSEMRARGEIAS
jgi:2-dehydropantoate 2-reductase